MHPPAAKILATPMCVGLLKLICVTLQSRKDAQLSQRDRAAGVVRVFANHSSSQETRLNDLLYGIKIWTDLTSVLSQCTRLTDGQNSHH